MLASALKNSESIDKMECHNKRLRGSSTGSYQSNPCLMVQRLLSSSAKSFGSVALVNLVFLKRKKLHMGMNHIHYLAQGVYFIGIEKSKTMTKIVINR